MATVLQLRRGNHATNLSFVGAEGELTYDTETHDLRVHDHSTPGGKLVGESFPSQTSQTGKVLKTNGTSVYWDSVETNILTILGTLYPVGSIYIGTQNTCPLATLLVGSVWEKIEEDRCLQTSSTAHAANTKISAGLPNITGNTHWIGACFNNNNASYASGVFQAFDGNTGDYAGGGGYGNAAARLSFDASRSNPVFGASNTVQPAAYVVNIWRRTQ